MLDRAQRVIDFAHKYLKITIGEDAGKPFWLRPWQQDFIRDVYSPVKPDGNRRVRRAILSIARKNGKTELAAVLILAHLIGPEAEPNGEIYSAANDREQASIVFNAVRRMIEASPKLQGRLIVVASTKTIIVKGSGTKAAGSKFKALSADASTKHGLNPSFVVYDELAQTKNRELLDTLLTSQGARSQPLFLTISTQNNDPQHPLSEMIDDAQKGEDETIVCHLYAANDDCDVEDEEGWKAANPALGDFRSLEELRIMAARAKRIPAEEASFRLLYLNQRVSLHSTLITRADWQAAKADEVYFRPARTNGPDDRGEPIYLGLDMSENTDLTALVAVSANDGSRVQAWFWKPAELVEQHTRRDRTRYDVFAKEGRLLLSPKRTIDPRLITAKIVELNQMYDIRGLAYDRHKTSEVFARLSDAEVNYQTGHGDGLRLEPWGQGMVGMAPAITAFEHAVLNNELKHDGHPLLTWCVMNAIVVSDPAGNRKFDKSKARMRIDGAVALAMALGLKATDISEPTVSNPWEDPNFDLMKWAS